MSKRQRLVANERILNLVREAARAASLENASFGNNDAEDAAIKKRIGLHHRTWIVAPLNEAAALMTKDGTIKTQFLPPVSDEELVALITAVRLREECCLDNGDRVTGSNWLRLRLKLEAAQKARSA